jgi:hypothetical protein
VVIDYSCAHVMFRSDARLAANTHVLDTIGECNTKLPQGTLYAIISAHVIDY